MSRERHGRTTNLTVVRGGRAGDGDEPSGPRGSERAAVARDVDWSILMARVQDGDGEAYRRLLNDITPYLCSLAKRRHRDPADVEDAVQDILLAVHALRRTYDPLRPFGPWLVAIANRRLVDRLRKQGRRWAREATLTSDHDAVAVPEPKADPLDCNELESAVERLPAGQRQAIRMLKLQEMSLREASAASGISVATLKVATHRGLKALRALLVPRSDT